MYARERTQHGMDEGLTKAQLVRLQLKTHSSLACSSRMQQTTYGFSLSTLHTDAIVQKQSVAFPNVREGF